MNFGLEIESFADKKEQEKQTRNIWLDNVEACIQNQGAIETARAILRNALVQFPEKKKLWMKTQKLENEFGTTESLCRLLQRGVETAKHEFLFILLAKALWKKLGRSEDALEVLRQGLKEHEGAEDLVLALQKLYRDLGLFKEAIELLDEAVAKYATDRIWMQAV